MVLELVVPLHLKNFTNMKYAIEEIDNGWIVRDLEESYTFVVESEGFKYKKLVDAIAEDIVGMLVKAFDKNTKLEFSCEIKPINDV